MAAGKNPIRLDEIIGGQRRMQVLSAILTLSGAVGLAFLYRDILIGAASRRSSAPVEGTACADSTRSQNPGVTQKSLDEENQHKRNPNQMKAIKMRIHKFSRPGVILLATVVAIVTSIVVANATQTITTPNAAFISYSLAAGANSAPITPASSKSVLVMGCCTTSGATSIGQVSLLNNSPTGDIIWVGLESFLGAAITSGYTAVAGTHIVYIDSAHNVDIRVASKDTILVHNGASATRAGNVTLVW
jgi:hypothetical protein